jgi:hypothetical protein
MIRVAAASKRSGTNYILGGARISLHDDPKELLRRLTAQLDAGAGLSDLFKLQWMFTCIHLTHLQTQINALAAENRELKAKLAKMNGDG